MTPNVGNANDVNLVHNHGTLNNDYANNRYRLAPDYDGQLK